MQGWTGALAVLHTLSYVALVGGLAWLVATERWVRPEGWASQATVDRALVATGSMLSVALATVIYTGLGLYWLKSGSFSWDAQTPWRAGQLLKGILFMGFWVHWGLASERMSLAPLMIFRLWTEVSSRISSRVAARPSTKSARV